MATRHCYCGKVIRLRDSLCKDCRLQFGSDSSKWPEDVKFIVADEQKELDRSRLHDFDYPFFDETFIPISQDSTINFKKATRNPEMDFEDFVWSNQ